MLEYIGAKLRSQGLSHDAVVMSPVYLENLDDFAAMNTVYGEFFSSRPPARATVEVARLPRDVPIGIAVIATRH